jgi:hypothetical protein
MDRIKVTLSRKVGPFSVGVWLFVIVAGVGLGLAMRRGFGRSNADTSGSVPDQGTGVDAEGFAPGSGISGQGNAPVTITRTELVDTVDREVIDDIFKRFEDLEGSIKERNRETRVGLDPVPIVLPMPKVVDDRAKVRSEFIALFGVPPMESETTARWLRRIEAGRKAGVTPTVAPKSPAPTGTKHTVAKGDTLWKIAGKYGFPHWSPIYAANRSVIGSDPDAIKPGQVLVIPAK